jgi:hypothetical protein
MRTRPIVATTISAALLVAGCSPSSGSEQSPSVPAATIASVPPTTTARTTPPPVSTSAAAPSKLTEKGLVKAGYSKVSSADPSESAKYYTRSAGVYTTSWTDDLGDAQELVGVRLEIAPDPAAQSSTSIDADEYSADDNNAVINDLLHDTDAAAIAKVCGPYAPLQNAEAALGIVRSTKLTNNSIGIYPLAPGAPILKGCLIYEDDPGVQHHKVWFDAAVETDPALSVPSKDGKAIWSGASVPVG